MKPLWVLYAPDSSEISVVDKKVENDMIASLQPEVEEMGYTLGNIRVSRKEDTLIVRADVVSPRHVKVGEVIRVVKDGMIEEGINIQH